MTPTSENVDLHSPKDLNSRIRALLRKHEHLRSEKLGHIHANKHSIYYKSGTRTFKSAAYHAGPKALDLE